MRSSTDARLVPCCITQEHVPQEGCQWGRGRSPSTSSLPLYVRSYELLQLLLPLLSCSLSMTRITKITLTLLVLPADGFIVPASPRSLGTHFPPPTKLACHLLARLRAPTPKGLSRLSANPPGTQVCLGTGSFPITEEFAFKRIKVQNSSLDS